MALQVVYVSDAPYDSEFAARAQDVAVVCAGDSITGWNNFGRRKSWPFPTYPEFLQQLCQPLRLLIADSGMAGEVSDNGLHHVTNCLRTFPHARYFVIGFGTNDLGTWDDLEAASQRILNNCAAMIEAVREDGRTPLLLDVPDANESLFVPEAVADLRRRRDYHNGRLAAFCRARDVPLIDIRPHLKSEHFGDELHPNQLGAEIIAQCVFATLRQVHQDSEEA